MVIAPPVVQYANHSLIEDAELSRLLADLATSDIAFASSLSADCFGQNGRVGILTGALGTAALQASASEAAARLLRVSVFPRILGLSRDDGNWCRGMQEFAAFKAMYGTALVPREYEVADFKLGRWVSSWRHRRDELSKEKIKQLDDMGFVWDVEEHKWQQGIRKLEEYRSEHGDLLVPRSHVASDGFPLGIWVSNRRHGRDGRSKEKIKQLDDMEFVWDVMEHKWQQGIRKLEEYRSEHGDLLVPHSHVTSDDFPLGSWVSSRRSRRDELSKEKIKQLDDMGFVWDVLEHTWQQGIRKLEEYRSEKGDLLVPRSHVTSDGFNLGRWVSNRRYQYRRDELSKEKIKQLDDMGFVWDVEEHKWQQGIRKLEEYRSEHGDLLVPRSHVASDGFPLGIWVSNRRHGRDGLSKEKIKQLDDMEFVWDVKECNM